MAEARAAAAHVVIEPSNHQGGAATGGDEEDDDEDDDDEEEEAGGVGAALGITGYGGGHAGRSVNSQKAANSTREDTAAGAEDRQTCDHSPGSRIQDDAGMDVSDMGHEKSDAKTERNADDSAIEPKSAGANCEAELTSDKEHSTIPDETARLPASGSKGETGRRPRVDAELKEAALSTGSQELVEDAAVKADRKKFGISTREASQTVHTTEHVPHESGRKRSSKLERQGAEREDERGHRDNRGDRSLKDRGRAAQEREGRHEERGERERDATRSTHTRDRRHNRSRSHSPNISPRRRRASRRSASLRDRNSRGSPRGRRSPHRERYRSSSREPRRRGQESSRRESEDDRQRKRCRSSSRERTRGRDRLGDRSDDMRRSRDQPRVRSRGRSRSYSPGDRGGRVRSRR